MTEDTLFAELGGFLKVNFFDSCLRQCSICRIRQMTEDIRHRSIFLGDYPKCPKFSEGHKRSDEYITNDTVSEFLSSFPVLQCV